MPLYCCYVCLHCNDELSIEVMWVLFTIKFAIVAILLSKTKTGSFVENLRNKSSLAKSLCSVLHW